METKICTVCKTEKPMVAFPNRTSSKDGKYCQCKDCVRVYNNATKERRALHHLNNRQARITRMREYHKENYDVLKYKHSEYKKNNRHIFSFNDAKRRALKARATVSWANLDVIRLMYADASALGYHVDHIVPLNSDNVCGLHCEANLQLLSASDNISKGNRWWPDMW